MAASWLLVGSILGPSLAILAPHKVFPSPGAIVGRPRAIFGRPKARGPRRRAGERPPGVFNISLHNIGFRLGGVQNRGSAVSYPP